MALDDFVRGYIEAALWSSTDDAGNPLDGNFAIDDIDDATLAQMRSDCDRFLTAVDTDNIDDEQTVEDMESDQGGMDFWFSRNGHGTGYFSGNYGGYEEFLQELARKFGEYHLLVIYPDTYQVLERTFEGGDFETKRDDRRPHGDRFSDPERFGEYRDPAEDEIDAEVEVDEEEDEPDTGVGWYAVEPDGTEHGPFEDEGTAQAAAMTAAIDNGEATLTGYGG